MFKLFSRLLVPAALLLPSAASAQALNAAQKIVIESFEGSCFNCHASYQGATAEESLAKILASSSSILSRLSSADRPMPPASAPAALQLNAAEKSRLIASLESLAGPTADDSIVPLSRLKLPAGYRIEVLAKVPSARSLHYSSAGVLYVGTGGFSNPDNKVYGIAYDANQASPLQPRLIASGLDNPNGVTTIDGDLFVAERTRIRRYPNMDQSILDNREAAAPQIIYSGFPNERQHSWKYLRTSAQDELIVAQGAPCNVCDPDSKPATRGQFNRIFAIDPQTGEKRVLAEGVRNTVGFDFSPRTGELWFTDNGRDQLGDNIPADELNRIASPGLHFGFPFCHATAVADPVFGRGLDCASEPRFTRPEIELPAHAAALGMRFYRGENFREGRDRGSIYIAEHGSWNRSEPTGYRISQVELTRDGLGAAGYRVFVSGWLNADGSRWGRPVDIENLPDGSLAISDDHAGLVYRLYFTGE